MKTAERQHLRTGEPVETAEPEAAKRRRLARAGLLPTGDADDGEMAGLPITGVWSFVSSAKLVALARAVSDVVGAALAGETMMEGRHG